MAEFSMAPPNASHELRVIPIVMDSEIHGGDSVADKLLLALKQRRLKLINGDILIVKHKIVSKAEGQIIPLESVNPSAGSRAWAREYNADARVIELALSQSKRLVRRKRGVLITETHHGFICANSGVDVSNVDGGARALLLPHDPDASATSIHREIKKRLGISVPVIITDSFGRPWREGLIEVAIGVAGIKPLLDYRGKRDSHSYALKASIEAIADELACAGGLVCGKLNRTPACIIRGFRYQAGRGQARELIRPAANDLFR